MRRGGAKHTFNLVLDLPGIPRHNQISKAPSGQTTQQQNLTGGWGYQEMYFTRIIKTEISDCQPEGKGIFCCRTLMSKVAGSTLGKEHLPSSHPTQWPKSKFTPGSCQRIYRDPHCEQGLQTCGKFAQTQALQVISKWLWNPSKVEIPPIALYSEVHLQISRSTGERCWITGSFPSIPIKKQINTPRARGL